MKPIIEVQNLSKKYKIGAKQKRYLSLRDQLVDGAKNIIRKERNKKEEFYALKDVSFDVYPGDTLGIIGRNGAGKSTLLKILSKITPPTSGSIKLRGRVASLLEVGTGFHPELTGRENIYLNGAILGMKRWEINQKFDEIVDFSGVEQFLDTPLKHYSSGMQLRLAFAVAAHLEPEILLIDEVLAVGDAEFQKKSLGKMDEVSKSGRTVLFVSHNIGAIQKLCHKIVWLQTNNYEVSDKTDNLIARYLNKGKYNYRYDEKKFKKIIKDIFLIDHEYNRIDSFLLTSGQSISFVIELNLNSFSFLKNLNDLSLGLAIYNIKGDFITVLNNKMANYNFELTQRSFKLICRLNKLPFIFGEYKVKATLRIFEEIVEVLEDIFYFKVSEGDYYLSGYPNAHSRSGIYIEQDWHVNYL